VVEVTATVAFNGDQSTQVISPVSGPVARILAEPGARVTAGQALALVASPDFAADLAAYRKAVAAAANAERIADLDQRLFDNDALARRDLDQAQTDAAAAVADRDAALEQLRSLGVDSAALESITQRKPVSISQATIRAPISGTVVEKLITPGQLLEAGATPCFTVANLASVWVMANVFESDLPEITVGDSAEIRPTDGSRVFPGRVGYVAALVDPDTRATAVRVVADNPGGALKRDMYVRVTIYARHQRTGILLPASAIQRDEDNLPFLFVAMPDGSFARRHVQLGGRVGDRYEIVSGVASGDQVITEGGLFVRFAENQ
jgi:cobalt-zinc-cadmium efflux system membrane fusion protein